MRKRFWIYGLLLALGAGAKAQDSTAVYSREFSFTTDNDAYLFRKDDAYYTNGFFFSLRRAKESHGKKMIREWELAQKIYTPLIRRTNGPSDIDRPYCGYLYVDYSQTFFSHRDDMLRLQGTLGLVGPASLGEEVQDGYHSLLDYLHFTGWQYQIQNAIGVDVGVSYARTLLQDSNWIKLVPAVQASLGMNNTSAGIGTFLCVGAFERNGNSALWNARIQPGTTENTRRKYELFVFAHPELIVQGYNSTVQGGLFRDLGPSVPRTPETFMWQYRIGAVYAEDRWTLQVSFVHQSKEVTTQTRAQQYAGATLSYRFR